MSLERPATRPPSLRQSVADFGGLYGVNAVIAFTFAATGPVAIILAVGTRGGLSPADLASWLFGAFFVNGLISIFFCWHDRQPLVLFWSIPGTVLVGPALGHLTFAEVVGTFVASEALMLGLGLSGWVRRSMEALPMPVVMGMVAGVFLRFGLDPVYAMRDAFWIAAPMAGVFFAMSAAPRLARNMPPVIGAMVVGAAIAAVSGSCHPAAGGTLALARPNLDMPAFSWVAMIELVVPLSIAVLVIQNGQGVAVLRMAGHRPPIDAISVACGAGSMATAFVGTVSTCLTGPVNAIISGTGDRHRQYTAGIAAPFWALVFGFAVSWLLERGDLEAPRD